MAIQPCVEWIPIEKLEKSEVHQETLYLTVKKNEIKKTETPDDCHNVMYQFSQKVTFMTKESASDRKLHQRNLQFLATEIFKEKNGVSTGLTEDIFHFVNKPYNLRNNRILLREIGQFFTEQKAFPL